MDVNIKLNSGSPYSSITIQASDLKSLKRGDPAISHLSDEDKDLIMKEKDERFKKTITKPIDIEPSGDSGGDS